MKTRFVTLTLSLLLILAVARADAQTTVDPGAQFVRGDVNADQGRDMTDSIEILSWLFLGTVQIDCLDTADFNDNGLVQLDDSINGLVWAFLGGAPPAPPSDDCGLDPTPDALSCVSYPHCKNDSEDEYDGHNHHEQPRPLELRWLGLANDDDVLESRDPILDLLLINESNKALDVELNVAVEVDGITATSSIPLSRFQPHERQTVQVELAADATLDLLNMRYSGHVHVSYSTLDADGNPAGQGESEHLSFHPSAGGVPGSSFLVYGTGPLLERFGAGNYENRPLPGLELAQRQLSAELSRSEFAGIHTQLKRISGIDPVCPSGPDCMDDAPGVVHQYRFLFAMPTSTYRDASGKKYSYDAEYGEDYGRDSFVPMSRMWAAIADSQGLLFDGYLDEEGATPHLETPDTEGFLIVFSPLYRSADGTKTMYVTDYRINDNVPVYVLENANPEPFFAGNRIVPLSTNSPPQTIYAAGAFSMERFIGDYGQNKAFEFHYPDDGPTATDYNAFDRPRCNIPHPACVSKYSIAHEWGHAAIMVGLNPLLNEADLDYTLNSGNWHNSTSVEWQAAAAMEGFANFVATAVWNDFDQPNADGVLVRGHENNPVLNSVFQLGDHGLYYETNICDGSCPSDFGVSIDWSQFFWNFLTDYPWNDARPTPAEMIDHWIEAHNWPAHEGFFSHFVNAIETVSGPLSKLRCLHTATMTGVAH